MNSPSKTRHDLEAQLQELQQRLIEAEETLHAIQHGEVDALLVNAPQGEEIYTLRGADYPYRLLIQEMSEGAVTLQLDGTILYCNRRFADLVQRPIEQVFGSNMVEYVTAAEQPRLTNILQNRVRGEVLLQTSQGQEVPVYISAAALPFNDIETVALLVTDLTVQKRQHDLQAAERLARSILDQAGEGIVVCDLQGQIIQANQAARALTAVNPLHQHFDQVYALYQSTHSLMQERLALGKLLNGERVRGLEVTLACPGDNDLETLLVSVAPLSGNRTETVSGYVVTMTNVTDRKQVEQALRLSEERFRLALKNSPVTVYNQDHDLRYIWVYPPEQNEYLGRTDAEMFNSSEAGLLTGWKHFVLKTGQAVHSEIELTRRGETFYYDLLIEPLRDTHNHIVGVTSATIDITSRRLAEEARLHSEERFHQLFDISPVALCEFDCTALLAQLQEWHLAGIQDLRQHFALQPQDVMQGAHLLKVVDLNEAALGLYGMHNKTQFSFQINPPRFIPLPVLSEIFITLAGQHTRYETEVVLRSFNGVEKKVQLRMCLIPDERQRLSRMLISLLEGNPHGLNASTWYTNNLPHDGFTSESPLLTD